VAFRSVRIGQHRGLGHEYPFLARSTVGPSRCSPRCSSGEGERRGPANVDRVGETNRKFVALVDPVHTRWPTASVRRDDSHSDGRYWCAGRSAAIGNALSSSCWGLGETSSRLGRYAGPRSTALNDRGCRPASCRFSPRRLDFRRRSRGCPRPSGGGGPARSTGRSGHLVRDWSSAGTSPPIARHRARSFHGPLFTVTWWGRACGQSTASVTWPDRLARCDCGRPPPPLRGTRAGAPATRQQGWASMPSPRLIAVPVTAQGIAGQPACAGWTTHHDDHGCFHSPRRRATAAVPPWPTAPSGGRSGQPSR